MSDPNIPVLRSQDFVNSIGVDTHLPYTDGGYANIPQDVGQLQYLGTNQVRDQLTDGEDYFGHDNGSAPLSSYIALAKAGQHFTVEIDGSNATTASVDYQLDLARKLLAAVPGSVTAIEGTNEINNNTAVSFNGQSGQAGAIALQRYIYHAVTTDPAFGRVDAQGNAIPSTKTDALGNPVPPGVAVDYFTGYGATGEGVGPNPDPKVTPGLADYDTQHSYPNNQAPRVWEEPSTTLPNAVGDGNVPHDYTESGGYYTGPGGVSLHDQAAYTGDLLLDAAQTGATRTNLYELKDAYGTNSSYGLFDSNGNAKPAATLIHNLTALLTDTGADATTFTAKPIGVTLSGMPDSGHSMQLAKSDGSTDLALWAEPGPGTTPASTPTTVTLDGKYDATVYDPLAGATPIATYSDVSSLVVGLTDHPIIVDLTAHAGSGTTTTPPPSTGTGSTTTPPPSTGTDTVTAGGGTATTPTSGTSGGSTTTTPITTGTGATTTSGSGDGAGSTLPPPSTGSTGSAPIVTTGDTGSGTAPSVQSTTPMVTPATTSSGVDIAGLTASITAAVTDKLTALFQAKEDAQHQAAVAHHDSIQAHNQGVARANLEAWVNNHSEVVRGDLLGTAIADAVGPGGYRAARLALQGADPTGEAHTVAWMDHTLGLGNAPAQAFVSSVEQAHQQHQGAQS